MATVHIRAGKIGGLNTPTFQKGGRAVKVTSSGTSTAAGIAAEENDWFTIDAVGGDIRFAISAAADEDTSDYVLDGKSKDVGPLTAGDTIQIIDMA